jgi:nucleoside 2-deoxyribosyltransferase
MRQYKIYLCGPVASISPQEAVSWREYAKKKLIEYSNGLITGVCPMRNSKYLLMGQNTPEDDIVYSKHHIKRRCIWDVKDCDLTLVNVKGAPQRISMGTNIEVGSAVAYDKPIICCSDKDGQYDKDVLFSACIDYMYYDLDLAIHRCCDFLLP